MPRCFSESRPWWYTALKGDEATSGIGLKPLPKRSARQRLTQPADATLVPRQARTEQVGRVFKVYDERRTEVSPSGKECWQKPVR